MKRCRNGLWGWVVPLLLLTTWLGARGLNADTIWYDEYWSLYYAGGAHDGPLSLADTLTRVAQSNIEFNPPGYYLLLNGWGAFVGWTPYAVRALSLLIGLLAVACAYRLGRDLDSPQAGLGAAIALGASAFFINYMHELRAYIFYALLTLPAMWAYWRLVSAQTGLGTRLVFVASVAGLLYTHYLSVAVVAALGLYHLLLAPKNRAWLKVAILAAVAGTLFLPWLGIGLKAAGVVSNDLSWDFYANDAETLLRKLFYQFSNGSVALLAVFGWYSLAGGGGAKPVSYGSRRYAHSWSRWQSISASNSSPMPAISSRCGRCWLFLLDWESHAWHHPGSDPAYY